LFRRPGTTANRGPPSSWESDWLSANDSVLVALCTSTVLDAPFYRLDLAPSEAHGLTASTQVMVDKIVAMPREKCGAIIGRLDESEIAVLNHMLAVVIGIADGLKPRRDRPPRYGKATVGKDRLGS
jgi:mRNA interferase MazF